MKSPTNVSSSERKLIYEEREKLEKEDTAKSAEKLAEIDKKLTDTIYSFVVPVNHSTPIEETLKKQSYKVVKAFNKMMTDQLSAE